MKTLIAWLVLGLVSGVLIRLSFRLDNFIREIMMFFGIFIGGVLIVSLIVQPIMYYDNQLSILKFNTFVESLETARENDIDIENTNLTIKIAEWNGWIEENKYKNEGIFDWYVPDEIMELETIE